MKRKIIALCLIVAMLGVALVSGTMAYFTDTDTAVNVMTIGSVDIEQIEQQRNGVELVDFVQEKQLIPAVGQANVYIDLAGNETDSYKSAYKFLAVEDEAGNIKDLPNAMDKIVSIKNNGRSNAYVRTIFAFEIVESTAEVNGNEADKTIKFMRNDISNPDDDDTTLGNSDWTWKWLDEAVFDVNKRNYAIAVVTHEAVLAPKATTIPSLLQVYMKSNVEQEYAEKLGDSYEVLAISQGVQASGFANATAALNEAFGEVTAENARKWFEKLEVPGVKLFTWEGVSYVTIDGTANVTSEGGDTVYRGILSDGQSTAEKVIIGEGITRLNNRALCKAPTLKSVTLPNSLTYIDESVFQQSGFTSIEIPENVNYIGKQAMGSCGDLETVVIRAKNVTISSYVARACAKLQEVYIYSDTVTFESGSMYFTNKENGDASGITFYVKNQSMADTLYSACSTSHSYGMLIKSIDGATTYYDTLK